MPREPIATLICMALLTASVAVGRAEDFCAVTLRSGEGLQGQLKAEGSRALISANGKDRPVDLAEIVALRRIASDSLLPGRTDTGLKGEYFSNDQLKGTPRVRLDRAVNFTWDSSTLPENSPTQHGYSIRWTGQLEPAFTETYTLSFWHGRRGGSIWIGDKLVVDPNSVEGTIALQAGKKVPIKIEAAYNREGGSAVLRWQSSSQRLQTVPSERLFPPQDFTTEKQITEMLEEASRGLKAEYATDAAFKNIRVVTIERRISSHPQRKSGQVYSGRWSGKVFIPEGERLPVKLVVPGGGKAETLISGKPAENLPRPFRAPGGQGAWLDISITAPNIPGWSDPHLCLWEPRGWSVDLPPTHLKVPDTTPIVALRSPPTGHMPSTADKTLALEAVATIGKGKIARVDFLLDGKVVGTAAAAPYRATLNELTVGLHTLELRAVSDAGASSTVPASDLIVRAPADAIGPAWWNMPVGKASDPIVIEKKADKWLLTTRAGDMSDKRDNVMMLGQALTNGDMIFRVNALKGPPARESSLGIQCRDSLDDSARSLTLAVTTAGSGLVTMRSQAGVGAISEEAALSLPCYLRVQITDSSAAGGPGLARVFSSTDGKTWNLHGSLPASAPGATWHAGIVLTSPRAGSSMEAEIEQVHLQGVPTLGPGVQLVDGSLIAGSTGKLDGDKVDVKRPDGRTLSVPKSMISKVLTTPVSLPLSGTEPDKEGVYIGEMDLCEGKVVNADAEAVVVDSVIFGLQRYKTADVRGVVWRGVQPDAHATEIITRDGSRWRVKETPTVRAGKLLIKHPLGDVTLSPSDVLEIATK